MAVIEAMYVMCHVLTCEDMVTHRVYNQHGELVGQYCLKHAKRVHADVDKRERETKPLWDSTPS